MIVSHEYRFIFIKTRKTAGTSVEVALSRACGSCDVVTPLHPPVQGHEPRNHQGVFNPIRGLVGVHREGASSVLRSLLQRQRFYNHQAARSVANRLPPSIFQSYFKFCFERNPWDKVVSQYHWRVGSLGFEKSFAEFVDEGDLACDFDLYSLAGEICVDFVGRYENLEADLARALREVGVELPDGLPRAKSGVRSSERLIASYYDAHTRAVVEHHFRREIGAFDYSFPG